MNQVQKRLASRCGGVVLGLVAAFVIAPAAASAGTVSVSGTQVSFTAAPGETNSVGTGGFVGSFDVTVRDDLPITVAPGSPCVVDEEDPTLVVCTMSSPASFNLQLGDGADSGFVFADPGTANAIDGGAGDDELTVRVLGGRSTLTGGPGNDTINPDLADNGRPLNPPGTDAISGGEGTDTVDYNEGFGGHVSAITVTLDGQPDDGSPGEGDNVGSDVENLIGSGTGDKLVGFAGPNQLTLVGGDGELIGGGGNDQLFGGGGNDKLAGGEGDDFLEGSEADDVLDGGPGFDSFVGDSSGSPNQVITGNDTIRAQDGVQKEPVSCGPGSDTAIVDPGDIVNKDPQNACESVKKGSPKPTPCARAKTKLKQAKAKLKKAKKSGTAAKVKAAKKAVKKAKGKVKKAC